jgi:YidC/Oxa1 family membrane protein insertase
MESSLATTAYEVVKPSDTSVTFHALVDKNLDVTKTFEVEAGLGPKAKYEIKVKIAFKNKGREPLHRAYALVAPAGVVPDKTAYAPYLMAQMAVDQRPEDRSVPIRDHPVMIQTRTPDQLASEADKSYTVTQNFDWVGVTNNYFGALVQPGDGKGRPAWIYAATLRPLGTRLEEGAPPTPNILTELTAKLDLKPGEETTHEYFFYAGPKRKSDLEQYGNMVDVLNYDYGKFGEITKLFLWMLAAFHRVIPNYGWGIVFLTLLVKVALHPLTRKTQISMYKMQKLQPKIKDLREKYKHDQKTLGTAQWKLFKEHRVNPLGGCLPMVLQIPVLIALYNGIAYSIEFRQQPFLGWITDLSRPDTLAALPFTLPLLGSQLHVLPLIMVVTWVIQQMTMPKPVDPQQAQQQKMMMFMPIIFGVMFYSMPSGLVLYWLTNTALGIVEQWWIKKHLAKIVIE